MSSPASKRVLAAVMIQERELLLPKHPMRARIDRMLGRLVSVGVAEAHELELKVEMAANGLY
ncbi:hypothetical protein [Pseudomonas sp. GV071]|uniref:hypothetical protein n=1 Tax=Pseudomonas sp. GV071 TaxID=2135754 RepID=UPI0011B25E1E|nr:hypothetical protein [Pseudomonas sp. GV071]